ncbi:hypothetical protein ABPG73_017731 [Tetrahymena malaccensis]
MSSNIGGSFGGLTTIKCLDNNHYNIILVDKKTYFEYTPSIPFALIYPNYLDKITFNLEDFAKQNNCQYIQGNLQELYKDKALIRLSSTEIKTIKFDYCVISTGSNYASQIKSDNQILNLEQRKEQIQQLVNKLKNSKKILIVGGGFVATEIAGILSQNYNNLQIQLWCRQSELLSQYPENARKLATQILVKQGVLIEYDKEVNSLPENQFDYTFDCRGNIYAPDFMKSEFSEYLDEKGRILVDNYCRLKGQQNIFCIGDACITPNNESKMGYNATIQGQFAADNITNIENKSKSLKKLEGNANIFFILINKNVALKCFGEKVSQVSTKEKQTFETRQINAYKGSKFYSMIQTLSRKILVIISGCQKKKKSDSQISLKISPNHQQESISISKVI